jgi:hypothetical protein
MEPGKSPIGGCGVLKNRYPVATRVRKIAKPFERVTVVRRFGTEGLEVQILLPRPLSTVSFATFLQRGQTEEGAFNGAFFLSDPSKAHAAIGFQPVEAPRRA